MPKWFPMIFIKNDFHSKKQSEFITINCNIANRFKQHIKRGLGAETPTKNKLYTAMKEFGVENFTFEVVQECKQSELNKQEDYWQDYFKAKEFGYSIK